MLQAESDQQVLEWFIRIIDDLAKIKSKKYKHEAEKYVDFVEVLDQINIPSKMPRQTYYQVIKAKKWIDLIWLIWFLIRLIRLNDLTVD